MIERCRWQPLLKLVSLHRMLVSRSDTERQKKKAKLHDDATTHNRAAAWRRNIGRHEGLGGPMS